MLIASRAGRPDGAVLRALVDSMALDGCCAVPAFFGLVLAHAYEESGDVAGALRAIRRGVWYYPPRLLSTHLREEGRLAARLGDRAGAIRAWEHYLALRSDPEPALRAQRDSIQRRSESTEARSLETVSQRELELVAGFEILRAGTGARGVEMENRLRRRARLSVPRAEGSSRSVIGTVPMKGSTDSAR